MGKRYKYGVHIHTHTIGFHKCKTIPILTTWKKHCSEILVTDHCSQHPIIGEQHFSSIAVEYRLVQVLWRKGGQFLPKVKMDGDFPGDPAVKTLCCTRWFNPWGDYNHVSHVYIFDSTILLPGIYYIHAYVQNDLCTSYSL